MYSILGFFSVPITFSSIRLFRTIHPVQISNGESASMGSFAMGPKMRLAIFFSLLTFTFVYATLLWHRVRLERQSVKLQEMKMLAQVQVVWLL